METSSVAPQHDDHIWLTVVGEGWAIRAINGNFIYLWRGYAPFIEYSGIDMRDFNYNKYCDMAVEMLEKEYGR